MSHESTKLRLMRGILRLRVRLRRSYLALHHHTSTSANATRRQDVW